MGRRVDLHRMICDKFSEIGKWVWNPFDFENDDVETAIREEAPKHVYYQPPASKKLMYPCVVYRLDDMPSMYANNLPYRWDHVYQLTVIDRDPESVVREKMAELPTARFKRSFVSDNLNHYVFSIYY